MYAVDFFSIMASDDPMKRKAVRPGGVVAVTGASGFIGSHVCKCLLDRGFKVRAVVRDKDDSRKVAHLHAMAVALPAGSLAVYSGDLSKPGSYDAAFEGADAVIHTAAVVEVARVDDPESQVVAPSVEGTRHVLSSLDRSTTVRRLVHTSSIAAVYSADRPSGTVFTDCDWNDHSTVANGDAYGYAKTQAERLVHEHVSQGTPYDFVAINPAIVLGPCLTKAHTKASALFVRELLYGNPQLPFYGSFVDVRDVAEAHVRALVNPAAAGRRFLLTEPGPPRWLMDLGPILVAQFPQYDIRPKAWPWHRVAYLRALTTLGLAPASLQAHLLIKQFRFDSTLATSILGIHFRGIEEMVRDTAASMVDSGWVVPKQRTSRL